MGYDFDLFVIGAGSGGVRAARIAAKLGARVGICEDKRLGGTCVNVGCVPKKLMVIGSRYPADAADAAGFGWDFPAPKLDWERANHNREREILRLNGIYLRLLENSGCTVVSGRGSIVDAHTVQIGDRSFTAANILIATGGRPRRPDIPGADRGISSDEVFSLPTLPRRIVIVGGGYIGVEFAGIFRGYGSEVSLVHRRNLVLTGFDDDIRVFLGEQMTGQGIDLRLGCQITGIEKTGDALRVTSTDGHTIDTDVVLWATGRSPNTAGLGLERVGITLGTRREIPVDDNLQTSVPSIYACGDVIGRVALTPVALEEGMMLAHNLFGGQNRTMNYELIPTAVFSRPSIGTVGMTEAAARRAGHQVTIYRSSFRQMKHTISGRNERTLMKLIVDKKTDVVLGCHMVGDEAGEIIQGLGVALKAGATKAIFDDTIGIHPTAAEEFVTMRTPVAE
ncbi:MAG: glutathione-disulfide reductase [Myxococcota bacterium]|nr:glutathione-disulfide reductase [Myxococcota bacterium]